MGTVLFVWNEDLGSYDDMRDYVGGYSSNTFYYAFVVDDDDGDDVGKEDFRLFVLGSLTSLDVMN